MTLTLLSSKPERRKAWSWWTLAGVCAVVTGLWGCATPTATGDDREAADLSQFRTFYVVRSADDTRGIDRVILHQLDLLGLKATSGVASARPSDVDGEVTYLATWVDNSLFKLEIEIRPAAGGLKGTRAGSYLQRKQPDGMVHELLQIILPPRAAEARAK